MADSDASQVPCSDMFSFTLTRNAGRNAPRLGKLALKGRKEILTPGFIANTSRGVVPHLTADVQEAHTQIGGVYMALEDFVEKIPPKIPPIYLFPERNGVSRLRGFTTQPDDSVIVMGPRRVPPVTGTHQTSTKDAIMLCTSVGFRHEKVDVYVQSATKLSPDIFIAPADIVYNPGKATKRMEKMANRSSDWVELTFKTAEKTPSFPPVFLPLLAVPYEKQMIYLSDVSEHLANISGLAVYDPVILPDLPDEMSSLPRLSLYPISTPHDILECVTSGIDIFTIPFVTAASDAGIALTFSFPGSSCTQEPLQMGTDLSLPELASSLLPMTPNCNCFACTTNSQAYIQHLLGAKEMTGWVFLQIHNHYVVTKFFEKIRESIAASTFEADCEVFKKTYVADLPEKTGAGPRVRGYQYKSEGPGEKKRNPPAFKAGLSALGGASPPPPVEVGAEELVMADDVTAETLQEQGMGEVDK